MKPEQHDPLDHIQHAKYHITGLNPTRSVHQFTIHLDQSFAEDLKQTSVPMEQQLTSAENLSAMFLNGMFTDIKFYDDTYLLKKIKVGGQEAGLHYHGKQENTYEYGVKNIDYHEQCVQIIAVFTRWVEYATQFLTEGK